jgi:hypothetical protein
MIFIDLSEKLIKSKVTIFFIKKALKIYKKILWDKIVKNTEMMYSIIRNISMSIISNRNERNTSCDHNFSFLCYIYSNSDNNLIIFSISSS